MRYSIGTFGSRNRKSNVSGSNDYDVGLKYPDEFSKSKGLKQLWYKDTTTQVLCTYPVILSFVHVCIYFWLPLWLFLELDSL